jgi:hypothetical protein
LACGAGIAASWRENGRSFVKEDDTIEGRPIQE